MVRETNAWFPEMFQVTWTFPGCIWHWNMSQIEDWGWSSL